MLNVAIRSFNSATEGALNTRLPSWGPFGFVPIQFPSRAALTVDSGATGHWNVDIVQFAISFIAVSTVAAGVTKPIAKEHEMSFCPHSAMEERNVTIIIGCGPATDDIESKITRH